MSDYIFALVKVFKEMEWAENFRKGQLFMNPLKYFIKSEKDEIGDCSEATAIILKYDFNLFGKYHEYSYKIGDGTAFHNPVFCMYTIYKSDYERNGNMIKLTNKKMDKFGGYAVIVTDVRKFLERIKQKASQLKYSRISYIDFSNIRGAIYYPILKKSIDYKHQKEFRIFSDQVVIQGGYTDEIKSLFSNVNFIETNHYNACIGDIHDLTSKIYHTEDMLCGVTQQINIDWNFCKKQNLDLTKKYT